MTATLWMSQPHQSAWHHNLPAVYSALPKADLHRTNMSECEECEQLMSGKTALNKYVVICKSFFPSSSSLYDHGCVISVAYSGSPIWICRAKLERGARSSHTNSSPLWRYCRPCNTQSKLTKHNEESNTHTDTHSNWAAIKAPRQINAVADWLRFHRTCQKPECKLIAKSKTTLFPRLMAFSWQTLWMDWAKISMMHDESCLLVSSMQWRSRLNPKFQAPCNFIRGFWSFDLGVAVTQSCFMCFSPQNSSLYWPQNDQIKRETASKLFFKAKLRHTMRYSDQVS